jgi:hypothetical protein
MASWMNESGEQIDTPAMFTVHPAAWRDLRARFSLMLETHGWTQEQIGKLFGVGREAVTKYMAAYMEENP